MSPPPDAGAGDPRSHGEAVPKSGSGERLRRDRLRLEYERSESETSQLPAHLSTPNNETSAPPRARGSHGRSQPGIPPGGAPDRRAATSTGSTETPRRGGLQPLRHSKDSWWVLGARGGTGRKDDLVGEGAPMRQPRFPAASGELLVDMAFLPGGPARRKADALQPRARRARQIGRDRPRDKARWSSSCPCNET
jgi:hypothetical protein